MVEGLQPDQLWHNEGMTITKSLDHLKKNSQSVLSLCRQANEPVLLTTPHTGEFMLMSLLFYEKLKAQADLFEKLAVAEAQQASGKKGITHKQMISKLKQRVNGKQKT